MALVCAVNDSVLRDLIHPEAEKGKTDVGMSRAAGSTPCNQGIAPDTAQVLEKRIEIAKFCHFSAQLRDKKCKVSDARSGLRGTGFLWL